MYIIRSNIILQTGRSEAGLEFVTICLSFLLVGTTFAFFLSVRNILSLTQYLKMIANGFYFEFPHSFNMRILILSSQ